MGNRYRLLARLLTGNRSHSGATSQRLRFTASRPKDEEHITEIPVGNDGFDGIIVALMAGSNPESAIRAIQALKLGREVDLGMYGADDLTDLEFDSLPQ
jgi:hypothetical protein